MEREYHNKLPLEYPFKKAIRIYLSRFNIILFELVIFIVILGLITLYSYLGLASVWIIGIALFIIIFILVDKLKLATESVDKQKKQSLIVRDISPILVILVAGSLSLAIINKDNTPVYVDIVKIAMGYALGSNMIKLRESKKSKDNDESKEKNN
ncbi:hypothetical protein [Anabaena sp. CCY 9910]|uniref:hypothetical protein n=1 Tax=Anabaena sp. CCY 9910 TaxID=3103870 RepID=UPI0039E191E1